MMERKRAKINMLKMQLKQSLDMDNIINNQVSQEEQDRRDQLKGEQIYYNEDIDQLYEQGQILGEGCVGQVKKVKRISDGQYFACKMVHTVEEEKIQQIIDEFQNCKKLDHPNIVKVYELYIDNQKGKVFSIMEYVEAKQMFSVIHRIKSYNEEIASKIFQQILFSIKYLHEQGICHRDLKPNNILACDQGQIVKITDFNISKFGSNKKKIYLDGQENLKMMTYTGTVAFTAPEVFEGEYNESVDVWSAGVVLYVMLCGKQPFESEYVKQLIEKIQGDELSFEGQIWDFISDDAKDLLKLLLEKNPRNRITPAEALMHPFITKKQNTSPLTILAMKNMKSNMTKFITKFTALKELGIVREYEKRRTFGIFNVKQKFMPTSIESLKYISQTTISEQQDQQSGKQLQSRCSLLEEEYEQEDGNLSNDDLHQKKRKNRFMLLMQDENIDNFYSKFKRRYNSNIIHDRYQICERRILNLQNIQQNNNCENKCGNNEQEEKGGQKSNNDLNENYQKLIRFQNQKEEEILQKKKQKKNLQLEKAQQVYQQQELQYDQEEEDEIPMPRGKSRTIDYKYSNQNNNNSNQELQQPFRDLSNVNNLSNNKKSKLMMYSDSDSSSDSDSESDQSE